MGGFSSLLEPVVLVTVARGRESFACTRKLFARLEEFAAEAPQDRFIMAIWHGSEYVSEPGVLALESMLRTVGLAPFYRAAKKRRGAERAKGTRWQWYWVSEYLGWEWKRK